MYPICGARVIPFEGLHGFSSIPELTSDTKAILGSENHKILGKKYNLYRSRVQNYY